MKKNIVNGEAATIVVFLNGPSYVRDFHLIKSHKPYGFTKLCASTDGFGASPEKTDASSVPGCSFRARKSWRKSNMYKKCLLKNICQTSHQIDFHHCQLHSPHRTLVLPVFPVKSSSSL
jgi:hypothetical protein